jgi:endonuclease YncB( thermonuclease family)
VSRAALFAVLALLLAAPAAAQRAPQALDGDSLRVGGRVVRIAGIDAPELRRPRCARERALAQEARDRLQALAGGGVRIEPVPGRDRYRRALARVLDLEGRDIGRIPVAEGLAVPYHGRGPRRRWCA